MDADNDRVTVVDFAVVVVDDDDDDDNDEDDYIVAAAAADDDEYGLFISKHIQFSHQPTLQGQLSTSQFPITPSQISGMGNTNEISSLL